MKEYESVRSFILKCHRKSQKVVLIHGTFDLLHKGHIRTLVKAKKIGDILIVGIDSDTLVKKLKGINRPIISDRDRLQMVKSIKGVDLVFLINPSEKQIKYLDLFYISLYKYLNIDILASGANSFNKEKRERSKQLGIEYRQVNSKHIESTTDIINRVIKLNRHDLTS